MQVDFASGNWIDITPIQGLKAKHRDAYEGAPKLFLSFKEDGSADLSKLPISLSLGKIQRNALLAVLVRAWSFTDDNGQPLPIPQFKDTELTGSESIGEIGLDDMQELEELLQPYILKIQRKPSPKATTTASSTAPSKDPVDFPLTSLTPVSGTSTTS